MDFDLTEEQRMIRDAARDFAADVVAPGAAERDKTGVFPLAEFKAAAEQGFAGVVTPETYGGSALGNMALSVATARRGGAPRAAVLNTLSLAELLRTA